MTRICRSFLRAGAVAAMLGFAAPAVVAETLPWQQPAPYANSTSGGGSGGSYGTTAPRPYAPTQSAQAPGGYGQEPAPDPYRPGTVARPPVQPRANDAYSPSTPTSADPYGGSRRIEPYQPDYGGNAGRYQNDNGYDNRSYQPYPEERDAGVPSAGSQTYSRNEVIDAGHRFFGSLSSGLAQAIEYVFQSSGRPNGYILGESAGGAFIAGLTYGEGKLYTKHAGVHRVFWQGPSIGYDFGGDGARTMTLVYNLRSPDDIYQRFGGVQGSAFVVGGASAQLLKSGDVTLAPIRTGVGLRLGANIGYLKYTRRPTWNPF